MEELIKDETTIVKQIRNGDPVALEDLYNTYFDRLYSFVLHRLNGDQDAAEDVVQETLMVSLKSSSS